MTTTSHKSEKRVVFASGQMGRWKVSDPCFTLSFDRLAGKVNSNKMSQERSFCITNKKP